MNTTAEQIKAAKSIQTLCDLLNSTDKEKVNRYLNDNDLPTFGGTDPARTEYVFSWDATHVLAFDNLNRSNRALAVRTILADVRYE